VVAVLDLPVLEAEVLEVGSEVEAVAVAAMEEITVSAQPRVAAAAQHPPLSPSNLLETRRISLHVSKLTESTMHYVILDRRSMLHF